MTTPNGDWLVNKNPDHKRHYKRQELLELLSGNFDEAGVEYAIAGGKYRKIGLKSWSIKRPLETIRTMYANVINARHSRNEQIKYTARGTRHLFAVARKT